MIDFFKKKKKEESPEEPKIEKQDKKEGEKVDILSLKAEIDRLKAGQEAFKEVRSFFSERFTRLSEQIGELRSMILERDRTLQEIELKSTKAADLVSSVQPEKLMSEIQKQEVKIEAIKANLEGNEAIMKEVMEELSQTRKKVEFFRGVEEIIKLSEEVKKELIEIKKIEGLINAQADKVQTIYGEIRARFQDLDEFKSSIQEIKASTDQNSKDIGFLKTKIGEFASKEEVDAVISKLKKYISSLEELQKKTALTKDIEQLKLIMDSIK